MWHMMRAMQESHSWMNGVSTIFIVDDLIFFWHMMSHFVQDLWCGQDRKIKEFNMDSQSSPKLRGGHDMLRLAKKQGKLMDDSWRALIFQIKSKA